MTTRRFPRLAVLVLVAALAVAAGCTSDGDGDSWDEAVAAYVGETAITEADIDSVVGELRAELGDEIEQELLNLADEMDDEELAEHRDERFGQLDDQVAATRTRVLEMRILTTAADRYIAEEEDLEPPEVPRSGLEQQAEDLGLSPENAYVHVVTEFFATLGVLQSTVEPAPPTEADQREVHQHLVEDGLTSVPFEQAQETLNQQLIGQPVAMRNLLAEVLERAGVRVSPDYDLVYRVPVPIGSGESWLALPLDGSG